MSEQRAQPPVRMAILLAIGFLVADNFILLLPHIFHRLDFLANWANYHGRWNWSGKLMSLAFSGVLLACSPWLRANVGLRWRQAPGSMRWSLGCFIVCAAYGICAGFFSSSIPFSRDTVLFQTLMPGLDEELAVRGIGLALLERGFGESPMGCRLRYGWAAFITSILFGLMHGVTALVQSQRLAYFFIALVITGAFASAMALVRTRSGSLLWPILSHLAWDGLMNLIPMLR
jgi:uncharacterized protein